MQAPKRHFATGRCAPLRRTLASIFSALLLAAVCEAQFAASALAEPLAIAKSKLLVDFSDPKAAAWRGDNAQVAPIAGSGAQGLRIATDAKASWPGVFIESAAGHWDLSEFDGVAIDIRNLEDRPLRVILSINNPGADGRLATNAASAVAPPRGKTTILVPFGMWHGEVNHALDLKNIVAAQVILDQPNKAHEFVVSNFRAVTLDLGLPADVVADPFFQQMKPPFGRGVNLGNALEAPHEGEWGVTLKASYFEQIRAAGFECVRIPVKWTAHAGKSAPFTIEPKFFERVDWAVRQALANHLTPIVDIHHDDEIMDDPAAYRAQFLALWQQIGTHYRDEPPSVALELLNEPHNKLSAELWNTMLAEGIKVVRASNPTRTIVVGPVAWNGIAELENLKLPDDDRHLVVTIHYYSPFQFTHQGADWVGQDSKAWLGTHWTGSKVERGAIVADFNQAVSWGVKHHRPIFLGEFGSYEKGDLPSRARWTKFVAQEAAARKFGYAYWEFCSTFGMFDPMRDQWIEPLRDAVLSPVLWHKAD